MKIIKDTAITAPESDTERGFLDEEWQITLTRREVYWLRSQSKKRLEAAMQGMTSPAASPARRSMRREEYEFHSNLLGHLCGMETTEDELQALREAEKARQALELKARAERLSEQARQLMERAQDALSPTTTNL